MSKTSRRIVTGIGFERRDTDSMNAHVHDE